MNRRVPLALVVLLLLAGCEKKFTLPGKSLMVVNGLINSNGPVEIYLTTSYPGTNLNNNITAISDAQISLYENGAFKEYLQYIPSDTQNTFGAYFSQLTPQNNYTYSISISEPHYPTATAIDTVPKLTPIISCNLLQFPQTGSGQAQVDLVFQDDPSVANYYRLNTWLSGYTFSVDSSNDTIFTPFLTSVEPYVLTPINDTVRDDPKFLLFSDRGFNGQMKDLRIQGNVHSVRTNVSSETLLVELHTVSKSNYEYFQTYSIYRKGGGSNNISGYVFNNIVNGYGIFAAENWQENQFVLR